jgi:ribosomal protein L37AE/L43A
VVVDQRRRIKVNQKKVKDLLAKGFKPYSAAKILKLPISVVETISKGKSKPFYCPKEKRNYVDENGAKVKLCEKCGQVPVAVGFQKLCFRCWKDA